MTQEKKILTRRIVQDSDLRNFAESSDEKASKGEIWAGPLSHV
jgi:hypothetical protein